MAIRIFDGRNFGRGTCIKCGVRVGVGEGYAGMIDRDKVLWCILHKPNPSAQQPEAAEAPGVYGDLSADGRMVEFTLKGHHPKVSFDRYLATNMAAGLRAIKRGTQWFNTTSVPNVGRVWQAYKDAGFDVTFSPRAAAAVQGAAAQQAADDRATESRLNHPKASGLFPFQRVGVQWLSSRTGAILADEMGCGKTVQTLMALGDKRPVLLVVPASLKLNWMKEANKWRPEYRVTVLSGRNSFRYPAPGEIVIVNYDILPTTPAWKGYGELPALEGALANPPDRLTIIADEAHSVKTPDTQRTKRFRFLGEIARTRGGQVWLLTGTPLLNRPIELWNVFSSGGVAKEAFGSFDNFKRLFNAMDGRYGIEWGRPEPEVPEFIRRVQLRREKKDVLADLPAKTRKQVTVSVEKVGARDTAMLDRVLAKMEAEIAKAPTGPTVSAEEAKKVPAFPMFAEFSTALDKLAKLKTEACVEYIDAFIEEDVPFLVFGAHIQPLRDVQAAIEKAGKKCGIIIGDVSPEDRQKVVEDFQAGRLDAVCVGIRAGGVGLTLTRAADSVFIDMEVVPALNVQAEDRIHRIGQQHPVTIHQLILDHPLDHRIHQILAEKTELFQASVGASTLLPTEEAPANEQGSALIAAAAGLIIGEPPSGQRPEQPQPGRPTVRRVEYEMADNEGTRRKRVVQVPELARPAKNAREEWAARAVVSLTEMDSDYASEENGMGWAKGDSYMGHAMAALIGAGYGLSDAQWEAALGMLGKYWRQVGRAPAVSALPEADQKDVQATAQELAQPVPQPAATVEPVPEPVAVPPPASRPGIGRIGTGARGDVTLVSHDTALGSLSATASDGRPIYAPGGTVRVAAGVPLPLRPGAVYSVSFTVTAHTPFAGNTLTEVKDLWVRALQRDVTPTPESLSGLTDLGRAMTMIRSTRRHLWDFR